MDKNVEFTRLIIDADAGFLNELDRMLNFEFVRAVRNGDDFEEVLKKDAEWLKAVLPEYIDKEVDKLISTFGR